MVEAVALYPEVEEELRLVESPSMPIALGAAGTGVLSERAREARERYHAYAEFVLRDKRGRRIRQAIIHRTWYVHIMSCWAAGKHPAILAPWAHGKSTQLVIGLPTWLVGADQTIRTKIVCLAAGSMVHERRGAVPIEEISAGDRILAIEGSKQVWARVSVARCTGIQPTLTIRTPRRCVTVTPSHYLRVVDRENRCLTWRRADRLRRGDVLVSLAECLLGERRGTKRPDEFGRLVGFFLGDGYLGDRFIQLSEEDPVKRDFYAGIFTRLYGKPPSFSSSRYLKFNSTAVAKEWAALGLKRKTFEKEVPPWVWAQSREFKLALLEGFADADGHRVDGRTHIFGANKRLISQLRALAVECGLPVSNLSKQEAVGEVWIVGRLTYSENPIWRASWNNGDRPGSKRAETYRKVLGTNYLPQWLELPEGVTVEKVRSIEEGISRPVYDLAIETEDHAYVAEGLVHHNCNTDTRAMERTMGISTVLRSPYYRLAFPEVRPVSAEKAAKTGQQSKWTQHDIYLDRPGFSLDPTFQAAGVLSGGLGARCDLLIFDDVIDQRNAIDHPAERERVIANIDNVWMSRLESDGRCLFVSNMWHQADFSHKILERPAWCVLRQWISEDFQRIEQEVYNAPPGYPLPALSGAPLARGDDGRTRAKP